MILNKKKILLALIILTYFSFILGFILNENSAGAGSYNGDISWIWKNIQIFENNNLIQAINHPDFFGNRTPLSYILHKYLNPFVHNYENFRISILSLSLFGPIIFYFILKNNFPDIGQKLFYKRVIYRGHQSPKLKVFYYKNGYTNGTDSTGIYTNHNGTRTKRCCYSEYLRRL